MDPRGFRERSWLLVLGILLLANVLDQTKAASTSTNPAEASFQLHGGTESLAAVAVEGVKPAKDPPRPRVIDPKLSKPKRREAGFDDTVSTQTTDVDPAGASTPTPFMSSSDTMPLVDDVIPAAIPVPDQTFITSSKSPMGQAVSGAAAVARLGADIAAVAKAYGKQPDQLTRLLLKDKTLKVDKGKRLFYECERGSRAAAGTAAAAGGGNHHHHHHHRKLAQWNADAADPLPNNLPQSATGVPLVHSRPAATRKLYLDFDGHTTEGETRSLPYRV